MVVAAGEKMIVVYFYNELVIFTQKFYHRMPMSKTNKKDINGFLLPATDSLFSFCCLPVR